ncbi:MAG: hypothetical protein KAI57_04735 [Candidatus Pacebacteria bacterium]|nr:hypothetical protein [Candidatus Paceibacterota bacterium]
MEQKNQSQQPNLIVIILATALVVGFGVYFLVNKSEPKLLTNTDLSVQLSPNKESFDDYIYALNRIAEAKNITMKDMAETYSKMDTGNINKTMEEFKNSLIHTGELITEYEEINIKYQLAKNKLETIENKEMKDSIFDLTQALILYTETNNETIKFNQHLQNIYLYNQKDNYQEGNKPNINTAFYLLEDSFAKMDKIISGDFGTYLNSKNIDDYQNLRDIILTVN